MPIEPKPSAVVLSVLPAQRETLSDAALLGRLEWLEQRVNHNAGYARTIIWDLNLGRSG
jgi:hypothetical protein